MTASGNKDDLEDRVARLAARVVVMETIAATCVGHVLRSVPAEIRDSVITELRRSIVVEPSGFPDPGSAEHMVLWTEHHAHQFIDQIERLARLEIGSSNSPRR